MSNWGMSSSRCFFDIVDIAMFTLSCRYLVNIGTLSYPRLHLRHRDVDDIVSISCQHRYPVIGGLSYLVYIFDIAMLMISCLYPCQHRYRPVIGTLSYLVYIFDIAMLMISCLYRVNIGTPVIGGLSIPCLHRSHRRHRDCWLYRVDIGTLSYLVYIVDIAMLTISYRHRVDIGALSYLVYIVDILLTISYQTSCQHRYPVIVCLSYLVYIVNIVDIAM